MKGQFKRVKDRFEVIGTYVRDKSVLDVGCVDARPAREKTDDRLERKPDLLFQRLTEAGADVLGIDIDREGVEILQRRGFAAQWANAEDMDLGRRFEVIVAGEIIEHMENPGRFLENMKRHLSPDGFLIISTPNPFYVQQAWKIWRYGRPSVNEDHTCWFDPITLERLLRRTGFVPVEGYWVQPPRSLLKTWKQCLRSYFSHSFLLVARPESR